MQKVFLIPAAVLSLAATQPAAAEIYGALLGGYNENPFKFNNALPIDGAEFFEGILKFDHRTKSGFGFVAEGDMLLFGSDASDANQLTLSGAADYKLKGVFFDKKTNYLLRLKYINVDKTYVSRTTGLPGSFGGSSTDDRYDTDRFDLRARMDIRLDKKIRLRLTVDGRDKTYEDYTALGLSNLDYRQWTVESELRFKLNKKDQLTGSASYAVREYDDRDGRDLAGDTVPNFDLEYAFTEFDAGWQHTFAKGQDIRAIYAYKMREDNVFGYYDTATHQYGLRYRHALTKRRKLEADVTFIDYSYDNSIVSADLENDEPIGSKEGFKVSASYAHALSMEEEPRWWLVAKLSREDYDSVDAIYVYDRTIAQLGFTAKF